MTAYGPDTEALVPYPPADITPGEFEEWVQATFAAAGPALRDLRVTPHETIAGVDGEYDFDATCRFEWAGMDFVVLVEAKRHRHPIKRELVASLHSKLQSVGAQKGVMVATAPFQRGALEFARVHGIALVYLTEGRFTVVQKSLSAPPAMSRDEARRFGVPPFVGYSISLGSEPRSIGTTIVSAEYPEHLGALLFPAEP